MINKKSLEFHIKSNDYFGTLATVLNLIKENLNEKNLDITHKKILNNCINDLMYLQNNFKITK